MYTLAVWLTSREQADIHLHVVVKGPLHIAIFACDAIVIFALALHWNEM